MVYGNEENFVQRYAKSEDEYFNIHPNGRIEHVFRDRDMTTTSSGGLGNHVLMPQKRIVIEDAQITIDEP